MVLVNDIWDELKKVTGNSNDVFNFARLTDAVELLASKGDFDALLGTLDIGVSSRVVTLPSEVQSLLAVNMCGRPALARDELFLYHQNTEGDCSRANRYEWVDLSEAPTFREIACAGQLYGYCTETSDENCELWVYGFDVNQNWIRTEVSAGIWRDGWKVPVHVSSGGPGEGAPFFARITRVDKSLTNGPVRLTILNGVEEILLGIYQSYDRRPAFRRIQLTHCVNWVRVRFRRRNLQIRSRYDIIPLAPRQAIIMALRALKKYDEPGGIAEGEALEATAVRWMVEHQHTLSSPAVQPIQVIHDAADSLTDRFDIIN